MLKIHVEVIWKILNSLTYNIFFWQGFILNTFFFLEPLPTSCTDSVVWYRSHHCQFILVRNSTFRVIIFFKLLKGSSTTNQYFFLSTLLYWNMPFIILTVISLPDSCTRHIQTKRCFRGITRLINRYTWFIHVRRSTKYHQFKCTICWFRWQRNQSCPEENVRTNHQKSR